MWLEPHQPGVCCNRRFQRALYTGTSYYTSQQEVPPLAGCELQGAWGRIGNTSEAEAYLQLPF